MVMRNLIFESAERAANYLEHITTRPVAVPPDAIDRLAALERELPDDSTDPAAVLAELDRFGSPATTATAGPRFFGFVTGGSLPVALASNWLAGAWDQDAGMASIAPACARLEEIALSWLLDLFGLPTNCGGGFVTGGTMANFTALAAARHSILERVGWDVEANGLFGAPPVTVLIGEEAHISVRKALGLLGFGRERVVILPTDEQGRIKTDTLPGFDGPSIVCIQAGNVNTGAFDPAREICQWAHEAGAWIHVDGAFGLWAAAAPERAHLTDGFAAADSWAVDAHKWLNVPYDSGIALVRNARALRAAMGTSAAYLSQGERREPDQHTPEMSRRARGVEIWAALRSLGRHGVADLVERTCSFATEFADGLRDAGYEILNDVVLNQVLVSFGDDDTTRKVIALLQRDGTCWCGGTVWHGRAAMRISVSSWMTRESDVEQSLAAMLRIACEIS